MIWVLLIVFQIKHFLADYPFQTSYMLGKFKDNFDWIKPLTCHCLVHALGTFIICHSFKLPFFFAIFMSSIDFTLHFIMDRIKASPNMLGRFKALSVNEYKTLLYEKQIKQINPKDFNGYMKSNKYFWWSLGLDQMVHHLTDLLIIYLILEKIK